MVKSYPTKSSSRTKHVAELTRILNNIRSWQLEYAFVEGLSSRMHDAANRLEREIKRAQAGTK